MKKLLAAILLCAGVSFGQSGNYNLPYHPQPRVLIPHVEAPQVIIENGVPVANPYRNLKYCDFLLKAVSQKRSLSAPNSDGNECPLLYIFSSAEPSTHPQADSRALVYYQDPGAPGTAKHERIRAMPVITSNLVVTVATNFVPWDAYLSASVYPTSVIQHNFYGGQNTLNFNGVVNGKPSYKTGNNAAQLWFESGRWITTLSGSSVPRVTNDTFYGYSPAQWPTVCPLYIAPVSESDRYKAIVTTNSSWVIHVGGSVQLVSSNKACAIEVYPDASKYRFWMKQGNPDVKWQCLLSNGVDFYRDPQSGEPMWFNVEIEWVDRRPEPGNWL